MPKNSSRLLIATLPVLLATAACGDDVVDPDGGRCCEVVGVDLVVDSVYIDWSEDQLRDEQTGLFVVGATDPIRVRYVIRNRGDAPAPAALLNVCFLAPDCVGSAEVVNIPALEPGEVAAATVDFFAPLGTFGGEIGSVRGALDPETLVDDPLYGNDHHDSDEFIVAVPQLEIHITALENEIRVGVPFEFTVEVTNHSRFGASPPAELSIGVFEGHLGQGIGELLVPAIAPLETHEGTGTVTMTSEEFGIPYDRTYVADGFMGCLRSRDATFALPDRCFPVPSITMVLPDLDDSCGAPLVAPDTTVSGTIDGTDCWLSAGMSEVWSFDATAGTTYTATLTAATGDAKILRIMNDRGDVQAEGQGLAATASFTAPAAGHYHVAIAGNGTYTLTLQSP